jgi:hypothetical protein
MLGPARQPGVYTLTFVVFSHLPCVYFSIFVYIIPGVAASLTSVLTLGRAQGHCLVGHRP